VISHEMLTFHLPGDKEVWGVYYRSIVSHIGNNGRREAAILVRVKPAREARTSWQSQFLEATQAGQR